MNNHRFNFSIFLKSIIFHQLCNQFSGKETNNPEMLHTKFNFVKIEFLIQKKFIEFSSWKV